MGIGKIGWWWCSGMCWVDVNAPRSKCAANPFVKCEFGTQDLGARSCWTAVQMGQK